MTYDKEVYLFLGIVDEVRSEGSEISFHYTFESENHTWCLESSVTRGDTKSARPAGKTFDVLPAKQFHVVPGSAVGKVKDLNSSHLVALAVIYPELGTNNPGKIIDIVPIADRAEVAKKMSVKVSVGVERRADWLHTRER